MTALSTRFVSAIEYLSFERQSDEKHELHHGEVVAMSGASRLHNLITVNLTGELRSQLKGRECEAYVNEMRVAAPTGKNYYYPDVAVACDEPEMEDRHGDTLLNPTLVIEVLSPSTESYDRGRKFKAYRGLSSLKEYVLVSQTAPHVEVYSRTSDTSWSFTEYIGLDAVVPLPSIGCKLKVAEIYDRVTFPPDETNQN